MYDKDGELRELTSELLEERLHNTKISEEEFDFDSEEIVTMTDSEAQKLVTLNKQAGSLSDWSRDIKGLNRAERRREAKRQIKGMKR